MSEMTAAAGLALKIAAVEGTSGEHPQIERGHLLIGILSLEKVPRDGAAERLRLVPAELEVVWRERARLIELFALHAVAPADLRRTLRQALGRGAGTRPGAMGRSTACKAAFVRAEELAGAQPLNTLHLLAALCERPDAVLRTVLTEHRLDAAELAQDAAEGVGPAARPAAAPVAGAAAPAERPLLEAYGRDLSALAARGELGPVFGRRNELLQLLQALMGPPEVVPALVGERGVGKSAVVEALALRAARGKDPAVLGQKRLVELDLPALLQGPPEEAERRSAALLAELRQQPDLIVCLDALDTLRTPGAAPLRAALLRGKRRAIAMATPGELRRLAEVDPALHRCLAEIEVGEPAAGEALEILFAQREQRERRHALRITDLALETAVKLAVRFDPEHRLPGKVVALVEQACAAAAAGGAVVDAAQVTLAMAQRTGLTEEELNTRPASTPSAVSAVPRRRSQP